MFRFGTAQGTCEAFPRQTPNAVWTDNNPPAISYPHNFCSALFGHKFSAVPACAQGRPSPRIGNSSRGQFCKSVLISAATYIRFKFRLVLFERTHTPREPPYEPC